MLAARIGQTLAHIILPATNAAASLRFMLFFMQAACMITIGILIVLQTA